MQRTVVDALLLLLSTCSIRPDTQRLMAGLFSALNMISVDLGRNKELLLMRRGAAASAAYTQLREGKQNGINLSCQKCVLVIGLIKAACSAREMNPTWCCCCSEIIELSEWEEDEEANWDNSDDAVNYIIGSRETGDENMLLLLHTHRASLGFKIARTERKEYSSNSKAGEQMKWV